MATGLKIGDKVTVKKGCGCEENRLYENVIYTVVSFGYADEVYIHPSAGGYSWSQYRFELVEDKDAKSTQVGGNHYSKLPIQPYEYTLANGLGGLEHTVIKYVTRWKDKGGVEDLKKARHTLDFLIEWSEKNV